MTQGYFKGIAVVIDDGLGKEREIDDIVKAIGAAGGHVVGLSKLPAIDSLDNFNGASFFILDWNLEDFGLGVSLSGDMRDRLAEEKRQFLRALREKRHVPVFIFTRNDVQEVADALRQDNDVYMDGKAHIFIKDKAEVGARVYQVLDDWVRNTPSVLALKGWEHASRIALNSLLMDLQSKGRQWPVILWQAFKTDGVPPADELGKLIARLHEARLPPLEIDLDPFLNALDEELKEDPNTFREALRAVLENERFVRHARLDAGSPGTGDVFEVVQEGMESTYRLNIRPDCDCVARAGNSDPELYLLKGQVVPPEQLVIDHDHGLISERHDETIVFSMIDGKTIRFRFKDLEVKPWSKWKDRRIGRLLNPFLARLQQRYASYSQRPGLPRIPDPLLPPRKDVAA